MQASDALSRHLGAHSSNLIIIASESINFETHDANMTSHSDSAHRDINSIASAWHAVLLTSSIRTASGINASGVHQASVHQASHQCFSWLHINLLDTRVLPHNITRL